MPDDYDIIVVGAGLAGLTAGMYASRHGLKAAIMERMMPGNQIINVDRIEDFPGFPQGISGAELGPIVQEQAMSAGAEFLLEEATSVSRSGGDLTVSTPDGSYQARAVIIAAGSSLRKLGIPGEEELHDMGVSNCASCDGPMFQDQVVGVVGGGDSAADEALTLTQFASKVLLFHRHDTLNAQKVLQDRLLSDPKVSIEWDTTVEQVLGDDQVSGVRVQRAASGASEQVDLSGLFIYVGLDPNSRIVADLVSLDNAGHIPVNLNMETELPGLFAAGDIRQQSSSQLVSAAGDGATAAISAYRYISTSS